MTNDNAVAFPTNLPGQEAFFEAVKNLDVQKVQSYLSGNKALANAVSKNGKTALTMIYSHMTVAVDDEQKGFAITKALIANGADVNVADERGDTALHYAARFGGDSATITSLLDAGAHINALAGEEKKTPLLLAIEHDWDKSRPNTPALTLISRGADVNTPDVRGFTPLQYAIKGGQLKTVEALLEAGADPSPKHSGQKHLADVARENGQTDIANLIREFHPEPKSSFVGNLGSRYTNPRRGATISLDRDPVGGGSRTL